MEQILQSLNIDLNQVATNLIGFVLFYLLMAKFAWKPILKAMDTRREDIVTSFKKIEDDNERIEKTRKMYEDELAVIKDKENERINEGIRQGQELARQIEAEARDRARKIREKALVDVETLLEKSKLELKNYVVEIGVEAGRKASMATLDELTQRKLVERFVEELTHVK